MSSRAVTVAPSLEAARLKVARGRAHLDALDRACELYVDSGALEFYAEQASDGAQIARVRVYEDPPIELSLLCGDAVHNLRTALDYLVRQLGIADSGLVNETSAWPVVRHEDKWPAIAGRTLGLLAPDHAAIIRGYQTFVDDSAGSDAIKLHALDQLDRMDKHRLALPALGAAVAGRLQRDDTGASDQIWSSHEDPFPLVDEDELFRLPRTVQPDYKAVVEVIISFGVMGGPNSTEIRVIADLVDEIIERFEPSIRAAAQ